MALSADQKAMLQLLLERGQSYSDLGDILGVEAGEVRTRARAALTELAGVDPDRNVGLTDYILGQADPIDRADAVRHLKDDPEDFELVKELAQKLRLVAPEAELPRLPGEERQPRPRRARSERAPGRLRKLMPGGGDAEAGAPHTTLTRRQTQGLVGLGSAAVLIIVGVLAIAGVFNGDSSSANDSTTAASGNSTTTTGTQNLTRVSLKAQGGSGASGTTVFGIANGSTPFVDVKLQGLKPLPKSQTYVIWLLLTPNQGYPLSPIGSCDAGAKSPCVANDGTFSSRFEIPSPILPVITKVQLVDVSVAPTKTVITAVTQALKQKNVVINKPGTSVLQGTIPKSGGPTG